MVEDEHILPFWIVWTFKYDSLVYPGNKKYEIRPALAKFVNKVTAFYLAKK